MINYALLTNSQHYNQFTMALRTLCEGNLTVGADCGVNVQLRSEIIRRVYFEKDHNMFRTCDWAMVWNPDGSSCADKVYDIIRFGIDVKHE